MIVFLKNKLRNFDRMRRQKMHLLEGMLYRLIKNDSELETELIPNAEVKRVLVTRNNKRIGNILFLIPFVRQVRLAYPDAQIDLILAMPWQGQFFNGLGINNIYYSHFSFFGIFKYFDLIKQLNQLQYDLILAPNCSASDTITAAIIASKNKVSTYNKISVSAFPHSVTISSSLKHAAYGSLPLLKKLGHKLEQPFNHNLAFSDDEINQGRELSRKYITGDDTVNLVFFRGARGVKFLTPQVWETILEKFEAGIEKKINWIEILSPDIKEPLRGNTKTFETKNMRLLGAFLKNFDGFICCDTGPLHLADASEVKCIGLYTHTNPDDFGLLGDKCVHISDINNFQVSEITQKLGVPTNHQE